VVSATLKGDDCVLGVDELELYFPCYMRADVGMRVWMMSGRGKAW
jgi:hypothetical protein